MFMPRWVCWMMPGALLILAAGVAPVMRWMLDDRSGLLTWLVLAVVGMYLLLGAILLCLWLTICDVLTHWLRERAANRQPPWEVCRACGYNLIASKDRCPECGRTIPAWPIARARIRVVRGFVIVSRGRFHG